MLFLWFAFTVACAGQSFMMLRIAARWEQEVRMGRLTITMGEGPSGVSYRIAACQVFAYVFAFASGIFTVILLTDIYGP